MRLRYKLGLAFIMVILIGVCFIGLNRYLLNDKEEEQPKQEAVVVSNIPKYGYTLDDRDNKYMKEIFEELVNTLSSEEIVEEDYAEMVAKLFITDFYTLDNKINKYDVGGLEYVYSPKKEEFNTKARDTIYKDLIDNTYQDRIQDLPEITNVEVLNIEPTKIKLNEEQQDGYKVTMKYTYKENLGYDTEGTCYLVNNDNKLEVAMYTPTIES